AILRQVDPDLDVDTIKDILIQSAVDLGTVGEDNTYGHGIINLVDAVALASSGFGYVEGYVTDATNSDPIPAKVELVGESRSVQANSSGYYFMAAPADSASYTIRASYFGYLPQDQSVLISENDTSTVNFQLSPAPVAVLQGTVTSLAGDSIGNAEITIVDTPLQPESTNSQGFYQFSAVPSGTSYLVEVRAIGYSHDSDSIFIQYGQTNVLDFSLQPAESFENSNGGFTGSGEWEWGTATQGPPSAWSGVKLWGTDLDNNYNNNADYPLYSIDYLISSPIARLEFYQWYAIESGWDGGNVSISTNGGSTWTLINPDGGYPDNSVNGLDGEPGYTGSSDWTLAVFDISSYYGETVRFKWRFGADGSITDDGWYIDDVVVVGTTPPEPPDIAYDPPFYGVTVAPGDVETRDLRIYNNGNGPLLFNLNATTSSPLLVNGKSIPVSIASINREPIDFYTDKGAKDGMKEEPIYPPVIAGQGGPDTFGHTWIDSDEPGGPSVSWVDISSVGTEVFPGEDSYVSAPIGFSFPFYENSYTSLFICSNGMLTFGSGSGDYGNDPIPHSNTPHNFIAPWWDDLSPQDGHVYYYQDTANNR
ncbi:MAG: carboxypeptidase regulatory-like domain-containing protein, partial [Candidatus Zixiibacteriota bacterium]